MLCDDEQKNEDVYVTSYKLQVTSYKQISRKKNSKVFIRIVASGTHARTTQRCVHTDRKRHHDTTQSPGGLQMNLY